MLDRKFLAVYNKGTRTKILEYNAHRAEGGILYDEML